MTLEENYNKFCASMDLQSLMDYIAVETYINNNDWANGGSNNWQVWHTRTVNPDIPKADGKWRFILYDTEFSYRTILSEIYNGTFKEPELPPETQPEIGGEEQNPYSDFLYEALTIYEKYIHLTNEENDQVSWRVLAFFKPGTEVYSVIMNYYNDSNFFPDTYSFSGQSISDFAWNDPSKTVFSCIYQMKVEMSAGADGNKVAENVRYTVEVDVTGEKPLITSLKRSN